MKNRKLLALAAAILLTSPVVQAADGAALAKTNQCMSCHAIDKKLVGPAFHEVAAKYRGEAGAIETLEGSIRGGSRGKWGPMPMPSNPRLSDADLQALAEWILEQ